VLSYNLYWLTVIVGFLAMMYNEKKGHWPFMKPKQATIEQQLSDEETGGVGVLSTTEKATEDTGAVPVTAVRTLEA
jgi:high-affinity iron transporter